MLPTRRKVISDRASLFLWVCQTLLYSLLLLRKYTEKVAVLDFSNGSFCFLRLSSSYRQRTEPAQTLSYSVAYHAGTVCPEEHHRTLRLLIFYKYSLTHWVISVLLQCINPPHRHMSKKLHEPLQEENFSTKHNDTFPLMTHVI